MTEDEQTISRFLQTAYTDERLAALLAHTQDGKLSFESCCCFIGIATADHALQGRGTYYIGDGEPDHYDRAERLAGAGAAEDAFCWLSSDDAERRELLIPLILAEMDRRASLAEAHNKLSLRITNEESHGPASQTEKVFA